VPPKSRTQRRTAFSGSLLAVPEPLPDDEPTQVSSSRQALAAVPEPEPPSDKAPTAMPAEGEEPNSVPTTKEAPSPPEPNQPATAKRDRPPETVRLDKRASAELWDVYIKAKKADPFLSYRQFASGVVLDGLAAHRRRQSRVSPNR
jgi:hypothetical protein